MKQWRLAFFLMAFSSIAAANDWSFGGEADHLIPLEASDITIPQEKIVMTRLATGWMHIEVNFVFDSPTEGIRKIGFITPPMEPENLQKFVTEVNGQPVATRFLPFRETSFKRILRYDEEWEREDGEDALHDFVFHFDAPFKKGLNTIHHHYLFTGSHGVATRDYEYVVSTIQKWKNKRVEDFELILDMGKNSYFQIPGFWEDGRKVDWEIVGQGKQMEAPSDISSQPVTVVKLIDGVLRYHAQNFSPDSEISVVFPSTIFYPGLEVGEDKNRSIKPFEGYNWVYQDKRFDGGKCVYFQQDEDDAADQAIAKNCPFAIKGRIFSNPTLQHYFSQFFWYDPLQKEVDLEAPETRDAILFAEEVKTWLREDLSRHSPEALRQIKNAPYALRGYAFKDQALTDYFTQKYFWYTPMSVDGNINRIIRGGGLEKIRLTEDEKALLRKISELEKGKEKRE
jgi:hypothetical protein